MITCWRITKKKHASTAFDGEGARVHGGRWNSPGTRMVYTAGSRALAALEMAVHLDRATLLMSFVLIPCEFDESLVGELDPGSLPTDWRESPAPAELALIGDDWARSSGSAVLSVPSVIIPQERNYLLNPRHSLFDHVRIGDPVDFEFDSRLAR